MIDPRLKCDLLTDTRLQWASVGGLVTNLPLICGGETDDGFGNKIASNECYPKTSLGRVFDMNENRRYAASVVLNNDTLWVRSFTCIPNYVSVLLNFSNFRLLVGIMETKIYHRPNLFHLVNHPVEVQSSHFL